YNLYSNEIADFKDRQEQLEKEKYANAAEIAAYEEQIDRLIQAAQAAQGENSPPYQEGEWWWPLEPQFTNITSPFGLDWLYGQQRFHKGIDISGGGIFGHPIYASKAGTVIIANNTYIEGYSYGKYVVIDHGNGYTTLYGHASSLNVYVGQEVEQGDVIAYVGSTGNSTGPHLHFEVRLNNEYQSPWDYVSIP
ncbi:MAG: M23 family metallopeptidase, partial [Ruminiclostridium sp.]|nr:M23 family metallopeptidase [Ruminiclostridium sp.]